MTAASAIGVFRTPALFNIVANGGMIALGVSLVAMIGTGMIARSIPYEEGIGKKQLAWALHVSIKFQFKIHSYNIVHLKLYKIVQLIEYHVM